MWQGEEGSIEVISRDEAIDYLESKVGSYRDPDQEVLERFGLLEETA